MTPTFGFFDLPDYREWMPGDPDFRRTSFLEPETEGERLNLTGRVLTKSGAPLADVRIEFWQANSAGVYALDKFKLRGTQRTNGDGAFALETIMPGTTGRIRHINFLAAVSVSGRAQPLLLCAAISFATDDELNRTIVPEDVPNVRPGAHKYRDDPSFLSLDRLKVENGVRRARYDIVFDIE